MQIETLLDVSFDTAFADRPNLPWWPWVGAQFSSSLVRTMLVGESVYDWDPTGSKFKRRYAATDGLRITHRNHALKFRRKSRYVRNIERAIFCTAEPTVEQKQRLWSSVAYHNLVLVPLASRRRRPTHPHYLKGWQELLDLCRLMAVDQCLVYGLEDIKVQALKEAVALRGGTCAIRSVTTNVSRFSPRVGTVTDDTFSLKLLFIRHPSAFFSWRRWAPVIHEHLTLPRT